MAADRQYRSRFHRHRRRLGRLHDRRAAVSEDPATRVLLLEAGGEDTNPLDPHPAWFRQDVRRPVGQLVLRDRARAGAAGRKVFWPRGKVLGGSSSINGMVYIRGQA